MTTIAQHGPTQDEAVADRGHERDEAGAVSAEYAVVTAAGVGFGGLLIKLITSDFGQALLKQVLDFFLGQVGL